MTSRDNPELWPLIGYSSVGVTPPLVRGLPLVALVRVTYREAGLCCAGDQIVVILLNPSRILSLRVSGWVAVAANSCVIVACLSDYLERNYGTS